MPIYPSFGRKRNAVPADRPGALVWTQTLGLVATRHGGIGLVVLTVLLLTAIFAPVIAPYGAMTQVGTSLMPPSWRHPMGTDNIGRDLFSLVIYGSRASLRRASAAETSTVWLK
jgi:peptide/nickel transport system permease protein